MRRFPRSAKLTAACLLLLALPFSAGGYYHFLHYYLSGGAYVPLAEKFDLRALPGGAVPYLISAEGPEALAERDSFPALVSQIRAAAAVWNGVETSALRLAFGGLHEAGTPMKGPHIEIVFDEVPPGLVALGGPVTRGEPVTGDTPAFVPIVKSQLVLPRNLAEPARPSWSERLFLTLVHELGHTLGLQHSWASGVMSTEITRATTKGAPLGSDDLAGISALYPTPSFLDKTGSITGRVLLGDGGVHLASVVALTPTGTAVSALASPDGTYRLDGLAEGEYYVYAHPVPPSLQGEPQPVNLELPLGPAGPLAPGPAFDTVFYPGTQRPQTTVAVQAGEATEGVNFAVRFREQVRLHSVQTFSFVSDIAVKPATLRLGQEQGRVVLFGFGLSTEAGPVPGLDVAVLGAPETVQRSGMVAYPPAPVYLQMDVALTPDSPGGARHMIFSADGESHVAPSAFRLVGGAPPSIATVTANADRTLTLTGENLGAHTRVWFDGAAASVLGYEDGNLMVTQPAALPGHRAVITAFDLEGQSSLMAHGDDSPVYEFEAAETPFLSVAPASLPAGVEALVEVIGQGTQFGTGALRAGFGSSDVAVLRAWSVSPTRALLHVVVSPAAEPSATMVTAASGLQLVREPKAFQILPASSRRIFIAMSARPAGPVYSGATLTLPLGNLVAPLASSSVSISIGDKSAQIVEQNESTVTVRVPTDLQPGPAIVRATINGEAALPGVVEVEAPPSPPILLLKLQSLLGVDVGPSNPVSPGTVVQLLAKGFGEDGDTIDTADVRLVSGDLEHQVLVISPAPGPPGVLAVYFIVSPQAPLRTTIPLTLAFQGRVSAPIDLPVR